MPQQFIFLRLVALSLAAVAMPMTMLAGCSGPSGAARADAPPAEPSPATRAWMDRLTVKNEYDPKTGFIVAKERVELPPVLESGPSVGDAVSRGVASGLPVVAFATADRCAPCQQFKKDALNDPRVVEVLSSGRVIATHVEVDREPEAARRYLGGAAIPVTYLLRDGKAVDRLPGQRSADDLLKWLRERGV